VRAAEGLALSQVEFPAETIVFVDKWDKTAGAVPKAITDTWIEPFNGDYDFYPTYRRMKIAGTGTWRVLTPHSLIVTRSG